MPNVIHDLAEGAKITAVEIMRIHKVKGDDADDARCRESHGGPRIAPIGSDLARVSLSPVSSLES